MPLPQNTLTDGVVEISPLRWADIEPHLAGEDAELVRWLHGGAGTRATVRAHVRRSIERWVADGPKLSFGIRLDRGRVLAGTIDADHDPQPGSRRSNLAYGVYPQYRRLGVATRAVLLACRYLGERGDIDRILIDVDPQNAASARVARNAGFGFLTHVSDDEDAFDRYDLVVRRTPPPLPVRGR